MTDWLSFISLLAMSIDSFFLCFQVDTSGTMDNPTLRKGLDAFASSMNRIGDTIGNALEVSYSKIMNHKVVEVISA